MPVYQSVVIEENGDRNGEKTLYITPKSKNGTPEQPKKRLGTMARVLLAGAMILISLFLLISFGKYLYEFYGPEPEKKVETFDSVQREKEPKSELSRFISAKYTIHAVSLFFLAILGKFFWGNDDEDGD